VAAPNILTGIVVLVLEERGCLKLFLTQVEVRCLLKDIYIEVIAII
jgi:hypothetical protein